MGLMAMLPTLSLYIEERFGIHDEAELQSWSGIVFGSAPLAAAIIGPVWGGLGDRVGRKPMVLRAMLAVGIVTALMPLAPTPMALTGLRVLQGLLAGYIAPAMALVSASARPESQGRVISLMQLALALGMVCGPLVGAEVSVRYGREAIFWVCSGLALTASLVAWLFVREDRSELTQRAAGVSVLGDLIQQTRVMLSNRVFVALLGLVFLMRFGQNMIEPFLALFVRELEPLASLADADPEFAVDRTTALAFAVLAVAQVLVTPIWGRLADRLGPLFCLAISALCLGGILVVMATVLTALELLVWRGASAVFMAGTMTLAYAAATKRVDPSRRSMAFAMVQSCTQFGLSLGPILGGWLVAGWLGADGDDGSSGLRPLFWIAGGASMLAGIGMFVLRLRPSGNLDRPVSPIPDERA